MKKAILFGVLALIFALASTSCKKNVKKSTFNYSPPSWLIGNWNDSIYTQLNMFNVHGYKVTNDDIIQVTSMESSFKAQNQADNQPAQQQLNGNTYHVTRTTSLGTSGHYYFTKISNTKVKLTTVDPSLNPLNYSILIKY